MASFSGSKSETVESLIVPCWEPVEDAQECAVLFKSRDISRISRDRCLEFGESAIAAYSQVYVVRLEDVRGWFVYAVWNCDAQESREQILLRGV